MKRLISNNYFLNKSSSSSIKFNTVRDYFGTVQSSRYEGGYEDSCSESDSENEEILNQDDLSSFEKEFAQMEKRSKEVGFISSEDSDDDSKSVKSVNFFILKILFN